MSDGVPREASFQSPDERSSAQPQTIAHYRLDTVVASGGFGTVVRATDTTLDRTVAIKLIDDPNRAANLISEAKNTSRLSHPRIARVYQAGIDDETNLAFIAFEWVEGPTLRALLRRGPLPFGRLLRLGQDVAAAVAAAHQSDLVHGDLKADNVVISGEPGRAKLLDFGLSIPEEEFGDGELWGTPAYMAPELLAGGARTAAADRFALGVMLFEMATGQLPFGGEDGDEHRVRIRQQSEAPDARELRPELPQEIAELISKLLNRDHPERRPEAVEVERILRLRRRVEEGKRLQLSPVLILFLLVTLAIVLWSEFGAEQNSQSRTTVGGTSVAPVVSVGTWVGASGSETESSERFRDALAIFLSGDDPGSGLLMAVDDLALTGTVTVTDGVDGSAEWEANWTSLTGSGARQEQATGPLTLARLVAERVKNDNAGNRLTEWSAEIPDEAVILFIDGVRATDREDWSAARSAFAEAQQIAGVFPEASAWEAAIWGARGSASKYPYAPCAPGESADCPGSDSQWETRDQGEVSFFALGATPSLGTSP